MKIPLSRSLGVLLMAGLLLGAACAPAAVPTPTPAPAKPAATATPAPKPVESTPPAPKPAASPAAKGETPGAKPGETPAAKPQAGADWKARWDEVLAAARKEGTVIVRGGPGDLYRTAAMAFRKIYPEINVEYSGGGGADFVAKLMAERNGGQYLYDVSFGGADSPMFVLKPGGALDPLRPALLLPEVVEDNKWHGGFEDGWVDKERQYLYAYSGYLQYSAYVNRGLVPDSELSTVDQLLDPKWKGKIVSMDPRRTGPTAASFGFLLMAKGETWLRKLLAQDLVIVSDNRQQAEALVRGRYPIAMGIDTAGLVMMQREGLMANVKPLAEDSADGASLMNGFGNLNLINRAPHPNAAKVFINWLLSRDGQKDYVDTTGQNSRRLDVGGPPETAPKPHLKYVPVQREENQPNVQRGIELAKEIIK